MVAVVHSHSHVDHYGGVKGVVDEEDVEAGKVQIIAPDGFLEAAVAENILAGNVMTRRALYQYGSLIPIDAKGNVGLGLGTAISTGTITLIPPTERSPSPARRSTSTASPSNSCSRPTPRRRRRCTGSSRSSVR